jgi:hypothetical protein
MSNSSIKIPVTAYFEPSGRWSPLVNRYTNPRAMVSVNDHTGEITRLSRDSVALTEVGYLPPLHPKNYRILPTEIYNMFATGIVSRLRRQSANQILLRCLANGPPIDEILPLFCLDLQQLVEFFLSLLVVLEPLPIELIKEHLSPVTFEFNSLSLTDWSPSKFLEKSALTSIIRYFRTPDLLRQVVDVWLRLLVRAFSDPKSHFVNPRHPSAVIFPVSALTKPKQATVTGASSLLVYKTGFTRNCPVVAKVTPQSPSGASIPISNSIAVVSGSSITLEAMRAYDGSVVVVPVFHSSTDSLLGTFFDLAVSFKYFIFFTAAHADDLDPQKLQEIRIRVYQLFVDSYIAESPFFYNFSAEVLAFLRQFLPTSGSDFVEELPLRLSLLSIYSDTSERPYIAQFLEEQQTMWDERVLLPLKSFFPEFQTATDRREIAQLTDPQCALPGPAFPATLEESSTYPQLGGHLKRLLKPRTTLEGYPFHLLLHIWARSASQFPEFTVTTLSDTVIKVALVEHRPCECRLLFQANRDPRVFWSLSPDFEHNHRLARESPTITFDQDPHPVYLRSASGHAWSQLMFRLSCSETTDVAAFVLENRDLFVHDVARLTVQWDMRDDEKIMSCFPLHFFSASTMTLTVGPTYLFECPVRLPLRLLSVRGHLLFALNWLLYFEKISFDADPSLKCLCRSMSLTLRTTRFRHLIDQQSNDDSNEIQINRKEAFEVRTGASDKLNMTLIAQLSRLYTDPRAFRRSGDKPWRVCFVNESGIDAGGPARELVTEAAADALAPACGLFVPTPNARNDVGANREFVIPCVDSRHAKPADQYKFVGVLIGICIRSCIVQDFNFAPFVWDFLAGGGLTIDAVFEVDQNYRSLIESLREAVRADMDESAFQAHFNLRFVVNGARGQETQLTQRGRLERVTLANCSEFISLANEFRLGEMRPWLEAMRKGLSENLNFKPPAFITGDMIEHSACGSKEITFRALKDVIRFETISPEQQQIFLNVIENFTSEERSMLLKFATGRIRLPPSHASPQFVIKVDKDGGYRDRMPTSSTCFSQLHIPVYSSLAKATQLIRVAIEFTGTFENR